MYSAKNKINTIAFASALMIFLAPAAIWACDVPVYEYALQRWPADPYPVLIFNRGPLEGQAKKTAKYLEKLSENYFANIQFLAADLDGDMDDGMKKIWDANSSETLPHMVVLHPRRSYGPETLWTGPPTVANVKKLTNSPAREKIAEKILDEDEVAVWVMLESGDKQADDKAYKLLKKHVNEATKIFNEEMTAYAPPPQTQPATQADPPAPAKIDFSIMRISRADKSEQIFIKTLLTTEPDLNTKELRSVPMIFPVFGRGRSLFAMRGETLNKDSIFQICALLAGPCACPVKYQNPGVDMLFTANWERWMEDYEMFDTLGGAPISSAASGNGETATAPAEYGESTDEESPATPETDAAVADVQPARDTNLILITSLIAAGVILAVVAAGGYMIKSTRRNRSS